MRPETITYLYCNGKWGKNQREAKLRKETAQAIKEVFSKDDKPVIVWEVKKGEEKVYELIAKEVKGGKK